MTEFEKWRKMCDNYIVRKCGLGIDDLPDVVCAWDYFDDGIPYNDPDNKEAGLEYCQEVLKAAGFPME